jgi:hypothetical protein
VVQARAVLKGWGQGRLKMVGDRVQVQTPSRQLYHFFPLAEKVIVPARERLWKGKAHVVSKVLSLFEAQVIRKGKPDQPTEFGQRVRIDEVENGMVSGYQGSGG